MLKRKLFWFIAIPHFLLTHLVIVLAIIGVIGAFGGGPASPFLSNILFNIHRILGFPIYWPLGSFFGVFDLPFLGYIPSILNSAFWAWIIVTIFDRLRTRR